jgi:hypothetical protein
MSGRRGAWSAVPGVTLFGAERTGRAIPITSANSATVSISGTTKFYHEERGCDESDPCRNVQQSVEGMDSQGRSEPSDLHYQGRGEVMPNRRAYTFYYDEDSGELASITEGEIFKQESALLRADVLKNILEDVAEKYNQALKDFREWGEKLAKGAN